MVVLVPEPGRQRCLRALLRLACPLEVFSYTGGPESPPGSFCRIYPGPLQSSSLETGYWIFPYPGEAPEFLQTLWNLQPGLDLIYSQHSWRLCCRGLPVVWFDRDSGLFLYDQEAPKPLAPGSPMDAAEHILAVQQIRCFPSPQPFHPYYRLQEERWLESLLVKNPALLNRQLCPSIYSQVPTRLDEDRKVLDLLAVTSQGRLAVIELKVRKELEVFPQMLEYWDRVRFHLVRRDFEKAGYFQGIRLAAQPPLLYLVTPLFELHKETVILDRYLSREVPLRVVGINTNWKGGLKVLKRFSY